MREFKTMCKDTKTGMQMVLSECSYNMAVDWLASKGFMTYDEFDTNWHEGSSEVWLRFGNKLFIYDEVRGYLLTN